MRNFSFHLISLISFVIFISCDIFEGNKQEMEYFKINVDDITSSDTALVGDTLIFKLDGYIGTNGCYSFSHFEENRKSFESTIIVWGKWTPGEVCTDAEVHLYGREYKVEAFERGTYYLKIRQPDNSILLDSIVVK